MRQGPVGADWGSHNDGVQRLNDIHPLDLVKSLAVRVGELRQQRLFVPPVVVLGLGVLFHIVGDDFAQGLAVFDLNPDPFFEPARLDFVRHLSHPFPCLGKRDDAKSADVQMPHLAVDPSMQAKGLGPGLADPQHETRHEIVAEIEPLCQVGLDAFDEFLIELVPHKLMIR